MQGLQDLIFTTEKNIIVSPRFPSLRIYQKIGKMNKKIELCRLKWRRFRFRRGYFLYMKLIFASVLFILTLTPVAYHMGLGTHPMIGWNLYVIGDVVNANRQYKVVRWVGGCIPPFNARRGCLVYLSHLKSNKLRFSTPWTASRPSRLSVKIFHSVV